MPTPHPVNAAKSRTPAVSLPVHLPDQKTDSHAADHLAEKQKKPMRPAGGSHEQPLSNHPPSPDAISWEDISAISSGAFGAQSQAAVPQR